MVLIQHSVTRCYLQGFRAWTPDLDAAWLFADVAEAVSFCRMSRLAEVEIVAATAGTVRRIPMPEPWPASSSAPAPLRPPVVLPRSESGRN